MACQLGSVIGADIVLLEKNAPRTAATRRNPIPYDITNRTILNPRNTSDEALLGLGLDTFFRVFRVFSNAAAPKIRGSTPPRDMSSL